MAADPEPPPHALTRAEIDALLQANLPLLRAFVRLNVDASLRHRESCADVVQSVCRQLLEHGAGVQYRDPAQMRGWLLTAVLNKLRDRHRHWTAAKRRDEPVAGRLDRDVAACYAPLASPSQHAIADERAEQLENAFAALPPSYREVLTLTRLAGLSHTDVAAHLGKTEANVRMLQSRALARLSSLLPP